MMKVNEFPGAKKEGLKLSVSEQREYILKALKDFEEVQNSEYGFHGYSYIDSLRNAIGRAIGMDQEYTRGSYTAPWGWYNAGTLEQYQKVEKILIRLIEQGFIKPSKAKTMFKVIKTK